MSGQPFFKHDANAINDAKIIALTDDLGLQGYGAFWMLIELLRLEPDYKCSLKMLNRLERMYSLDSGYLKRLIDVYGLFEVEGEMFFSKSLRTRLIAMDEKKTKLSEAGKRGNAKRWKDKKTDTAFIATQSPPDNNPIASLSQIRLDKIRLDKNIIPPISPKGEEGVCLKKFIKPDVLAIESYCKERRNGISGEEFFDFYESKGWKIGKNAMKDWKAAVRTWEKSRKDLQPTQQAPKKRLPEGVEIRNNKVFICGEELPAYAFPVPANASRWDYSAKKWVI